MRKIHWFGLVAFVSTGFGLLINSVLHQESFWGVYTVVIAIFTAGLSLYCKHQLFQSRRTDLPAVKKALGVTAWCMISASSTWYLNHQLGFGPFVANGIVGILAGLLLSSDLAAVVYTASFVGMSASFIVTSVEMSLLAGFAVGIVVVLTAPIYAGIGGKGGTSAATAIVVTRTLLGLFS